MIGIRVLVLLALALPSGALAEQPPWSPAQTAESTPDAPRGAPYNTGSMAQQQDSVPLRDYLSSRIDQLRTEMFDRLDQLDRAQQKVIDERDQRYSQRFQAQQEAVGAALQAAKEQVANALSAAKEAVTKAETAVEKRFESVNEFRAQLDDQANTFMPKSEATVRFNVLEEKVNVLTNRFDASKNTSAGANNTWALVVGGAFLILALGGFAISYSNRQKA